MANIKFQVWTRGDSGSDYGWAEVEIDQDLVDLIKKLNAAVKDLDVYTINKHDWSPDFHLKPDFGDYPPQVSFCCLVVGDDEFWWEGFFKHGPQWDATRIPIEDLDVALTEACDYRENIEDEENEDDLT